MPKATSTNTTSPPPVISGRSPGALPPALAAALAPTASALVDTTLSAWSAAKAVFDACRAEEITYNQTLWMPAYHAEKAGGPKIPDHIDEHLDRLVEKRCDAEDTLMVTDAPDLTAVIWKMEYANKRWEGFCGWPDDWWDAVIDDLRRFSGGAA